MYEELTKILLENRGITDELEIDKFLNPSYETGRHDPFLMKNMEIACVRIFEATQAGEKIVIYSDYDCDGIPGAVIIYDFFVKIGYKNFEIYIPDRQIEGYGLNMEAIPEFIKNEVKLLITIDLGITAVKEVAELTVNGVDVIVTDHHIPPADGLPLAYAILNPKQDGDKYGEHMLCGAGVAFKLVEAMIFKYGEFFGISKDWEKWLLDMVGFATLSDQVPLLGENRTFAYFGLKVLRKNRRLGLARLMKDAGVDVSNITEDDIAFLLAPRINAASRMASPRLAFDLLSATDEVQAENLAKELNNINKERKALVATTVREAKKNLQSREQREVVVIGNPSWRPGILGLVATRLVEEYNRPAFVWGKEGGDTIKGSCRSVEGVNIVHLMRSLPEKTLAGFGGHEGAGGFSVDFKEIHFLEDKLVECYKALNLIPRENGVKSKNFKIDKTMTLSEVNMKNWKQIERLAPFGEGNPKPTFVFNGVKIARLRQFGKASEHLEIIFEDIFGGKVKAIQFFKTASDFTPSIFEGKMVNLVANFEFSRFGYKTEIRLRIVDIV